MLSFYQADMDEPWEYCWVGFHGRYAKSYLKEINLDASNPIFTCTLENSPEKAIFKMIEAQNRPVGRDFILTGLLYQFLAELVRTVDYPHYNSENQNTKQIYVQKAIDYIRKNYSRKITIEQIADFIGIDRKYMSALFQEILHTSPQEFLLNFRMDKACVLLCQNLLSIQDIAHSVGYEDPLLFSKMFKKRKGLSPTQYRNRLSGKNNMA
jgi:AraC-like DNA-binding protein